MLNPKPRRLGGVPASSQLPHARTPARTLRVAIGLLAALAGCGSSESSGSSGGGGGTTTDGGTGGGGTGAVGDPCAVDVECATGVCGPGGTCAAPCAGSTDCLPGPEWTCAPAPGHGSICQCTASGPETCDGRDDDCNGVVDDGATCADGGACVNGACGCPEDRSCDGACVDTTTDDANCGGCGVVCPPPSHCNASACTCPGGGALCDGACVDTQADPAHCGDCATACELTETCAQGVCECGAVTCGASCVDVANDPANCGACGHDCLGGACVGAACQAWVVDADAAWDVTTDATHVYWTTALGEVKRALLDGSGVEVVTSVGAVVQRIAVDATDAFVTVGSGSPGLYRVAKTGGAALPIATGAPGASRIVVDATSVYWSSAGELRKTAKDGSATTVVASGTGDGIAVDASHVYFTTVDSVLRADKDGSNVVTLIGPADASLDTPESLVVDATHLYVGLVPFFNGPGGIFRVPIDGGPVEQPVDLLWAWDLAFDADNFYWASTYDVGRAPFGGGVAVSVMTVPTFSVALSSQALFVAGKDGGVLPGLLLLAKP